MRVCKSPTRRRVGSNWPQRREGIMDSLKLLFWNPVFSICLSAGAFVVLMFCFDRFDKPTISEDENDPWKFVAPRNLTPPRQYLIGFFVYCGTLLLVFLAISLIGP